MMLPGVACPSMYMLTDRRRRLRTLLLASSSFVPVKAFLKYVNTALHVLSVCRASCGYCFLQRQVFQRCSCDGYTYTDHTQL